eukprot:3453749-Prymnesium_polylepis.1
MTNGGCPVVATLARRSSSRSGRARSNPCAESCVLERPTLGDPPDERTSYAVINTSSGFASGCFSNASVKPAASGVALTRG